MTEEEFMEWRRLPETKEFLKFLEREEHAHRYAVAMGSLVNEDDIAQSYMVHMGKAEVYRLLSEIQYEEMIDEDESSGTPGTDSA